MRDRPLEESVIAELENEIEACNKEAGCTYSS